MFIEKSFQECATFPIIPTGIIGLFFFVLGARMGMALKYVGTSNEIPRLCFPSPPVGGSGWNDI